MLLNVPELIFLRYHGTIVSIREGVIGSLLGTAVGDSLGLPFEGLVPARARRLFSGSIRQRLVFGRGMLSDDTDHACLTALAITRSPSDHDLFIRNLAWYLRFWGASLPAGIGFATLRAIGKLWLGFGCSSSGVFSAGNGPAMRSPIIGASFVDDDPGLVTMVRLSTRLTHTDPKAEAGALLAAFATRYAIKNPGKSPSSSGILESLRVALGEDITKELSILVEKADKSAASGCTTPEFAASIGLERGVSGYMYHTIPCVLHAWFRHPDDFRAAIEDLLACGGDADTTCAILGGIMGAGLGKAGIPADWLNGIMDWPWNVTSIEEAGNRLAKALESRLPQPVPAIIWPAVFVRNLAFLAIILGHGFRRLLPPY
ncbi:MAG: ADP-ribosylglycohydrolase family protein [Candidatus Riflebacteria bacterium]|nr:ADP-ribosylglycohydrolase family protein [Candidatus Riflebacteria bacterium]